jgi:hypothetical protein
MQRGPEVTRDCFRTRISIIAKRPERVNPELPSATVPLVHCTQKVFLTLPRWCVGLAASPDV